ncbi:unnamed protein product [Heligmosomoides polygyrus]|uniref:Uncharacterized protein n=1 Tax=Heligmosomoides polygyrus TaxID=6339 RepID=A0A183GS82_HELPZ|nr:unnamed protein product [Heligmosomoides polygyrus]
MVESWHLCIVQTLFTNFLAVYLFTLCGGKKKAEKASTEGGGARPPPPPNPQAPKPPAVGGVAGTYDPNYQTLANIQGDVFGADKKAAAGGGAPGGAPQAPQKPATGGMADASPSEVPSLPGTTREENPVDTPA